MNCPTCGQPMPQQQSAAPTAMPTPGGLAGAGAAQHPSIGGFTPAAQAAASQMTFDPSTVQATDVGSWQRQRPEWWGQGLSQGGQGLSQAGGFANHLNTVNSALASQGLINTGANSQPASGGIRPFGGLLGRFG